MSKSILQSAPVSEGQFIELKIDSMAYDNSAVGRCNDFVILVDRGSPGDYVQAQITTVKLNHARAKIIGLEISDPNYRTNPPCKLFKVCGGCQWQHLPYEKQLEQKDLLMRNFVSKLNQEEGVLKNIIGTENIWNYRNKVQFPVRTVKSTGRLKAGYYSWHSNELVNIKYCPIQHTLFDEIVEAVRELAPKYKVIAYDSKEKKGWLRHICLRIGLNTNEALLVLVAVSENLSGSQDFAVQIMKRFPVLVGVCINVNKKTTNVIYGDKTQVLRGRGYIFEKIKDINFKISATSFFQVNTPQTERLLDVIDEMICRDAPLGHLYNTILDAYCGVGLISLFLAKKAYKVIGVEEIKQSIDDARFNARKNNFHNIIFINGKVENKLERLLIDEKPELVILDPPRGGCDKKSLDDICLSSSINKIIYISCNPTTLVRDLEILTSRGYKIKSIQPIDMFPHTYHIESVTLLERDFSFSNF